jgi:peptidoglycan-associated lipoprotein
MRFRATTLRLGLLILMLTALFTISCRKSPAAPPPPPPAPQATPPPPAPAITLRADPLTIERGQSVTLQWETQHAGNVRIEPGMGEVPASGSRQVSPASSVTYTATATGPGGTATDTARITVNVPAPPPERVAPRPDPTATVEELFRRNVEEVYFDYDQAEIRPDQVAKIQSAAAWLKQNPNVRFTIEGHADERGSQEYNLGLADRRANAVKQFLTGQGIPDGLIATVSYGEERPQCMDQSEDCYQRNRRAAFTLQ